MCWHLAEDSSHLFCLVGACRLGLPARVDPYLHSPVCPSGVTYGEILTLYTGWWVGFKDWHLWATSYQHHSINMSLRTVSAKTSHYMCWHLAEDSSHLFCLVGACRLGLPARVDPYLRTGHSSPTWQCDLRNLQEVIKWAVMGVLRIHGHSLQDLPERM